MKRTANYFARPALLISLFIAVLFSSVMTSAQREPATKIDTIVLKKYMLSLINQARSEARLSPVELDQLASTVAEQHCQEMLANDYLSHWNLAGAKPYLRYGQAGGTDAVMENVSSFHGNLYSTEKKLFSIILEIHKSMINEHPPDDGHRQTILQPQHTHVGLGISYHGNGLRIAQEFIARQVSVAAVPQQVKAGKSFQLSGRVLQQQLRLAGISLFYEPSPISLTTEELNRTRTYDLPSDETILRPILMNRLLYTDGRSGEIDYDRATGKFSVRIKLSQQRSGFYIIVVWLRQDDNRKFPATNIIVEAIKG